MIRGMFGVDLATKPLYMPVDKGRNSFRSVMTPGVVIRTAGPIFRLWGLILCWWGWPTANETPADP